MDRSKGIRAANEYLEKKAMEKTFIYQWQQLGNALHNVLKEYIKALKIDKLLDLLDREWK